MTTLLQGRARMHIGCLAVRRKALASWPLGLGGHSTAVCPGGLGLGGRQRGARRLERRLRLRRLLGGPGPVAIGGRVFGRTGFGRCGDWVRQLNARYERVAQRRDDVHFVAAAGLVTFESMPDSYERGEVGVDDGRGVDALCAAAASGPAACLMGQLSRCPAFVSWVTVVVGEEARHLPPDS